MSPTWVPATSPVDPALEIRVSRSRPRFISAPNARRSPGCQAARAVPNEEEHRSGRPDTSISESGPVGLEGSDDPGADGCRSQRLRRRLPRSESFVHRAEQLAGLVVGHDHRSRDDGTGCPRAARPSSSRSPPRPSAPRNARPRTPRAPPSRARPASGRCRSRTAFRRPAPDRRTSGCRPRAVRARRCGGLRPATTGEWSSAIVAAGRTVGSFHAAAATSHLLRAPGNARADGESRRRRNDHGLAPQPQPARDRGRERERASSQSPAASPRAPR